MCSKIGLIQRFFTGINGVIRTGQFGLIKRGLLYIYIQGRSQTFSFGGATGGASFATRRAVNGLCRTFRKRPEKFWGAVALPGTPLASPLYISQ